MNNKQTTAVQWLINHLNEHGYGLGTHRIEISQILELERKQIEEAYNQGGADSLNKEFVPSEEYFTSTFTDGE